MSAVAEPENQIQSELTFSAESGAVLQRLRTSISEMLNSMPASVRSTRDLQKLFGLDLKLCWLVMKLAGPGDALSLAPFVPTAGPMKRFLNAASAYGITEPLTRQIRSAYDAFEQQVATHAGDRMTFESMATGSVGQQAGSDEDLRRADLKIRKAGFQMHSHYCGAQMDTSLAISILHPSQGAGQGGNFDLAHVRCKLGQRRLRTGAMFPVDTFKTTVTLNLEEDKDDFHREAFEADSFQRYGAPILSKFCSQPLPAFETIARPDGRTFTRIVGDEIGLRSSVNLTFARLLRNTPMQMLPNGNCTFGQSVNIDVPAMLVISDQLVHRPTFPRLDVRSSVHWMAFKQDFPGFPDHVALPFRERVLKLEAGVDGARTREVPQYVDMIDFICRQMNWKMEDFDVYRIRIEYPLLDSGIWTVYEGSPPAL